MKYFIKHPLISGFRGPMSEEQIRDGLREAEITWEYQILEASGQSYHVLKTSKDWQSIETLVKKDSVDEFTPTMEDLGASPAKKLLGAVRANSAYSLTRKVIEQIYLWFVIMILAICLFSIPVFIDGGDGWLIIVVFVGGVITVCLSYILKHVLLALLDIADLLIDRKLEP